MKFALKTLVVLIVAAVVGVIVLIFSTPKEYMIIQDTEIDASQEVVWQVITDRDSYAEWQDDISKVVIKDDKRWTEITNDGNEIEFTKVTSRDPELLRFEFVMGEDFKGKWRGELKRLSPTKTLLKTMDESEVLSGKMRLMMALFFDYEEFVKQSNMSVKKRAEELQAKKGS